MVEITIDKMAEVSKLTEMRETTEMAQIIKLVFWLKFLNIVELAEMLQCLLEKFIISEKLKN